MARRRRGRPEPSGSTAESRRGLAVCQKAHAASTPEPARGRRHSAALASAAPSRPSGRRAVDRSTPPPCQRPAGRWMATPWCSAAGTPCLPAGRTQLRGWAERGRGRAKRCLARACRRMRLRPKLARS
eukprot:2507503-Prymnesium_polylepis.1